MLRTSPGAGKTKLNVQPSPRTKLASDGPANMAAKRSQGPVAWVWDKIASNGEATSALLRSLTTSSIRPGQDPYNANCASVLSQRGCTCRGASLESWDVSCFMESFR
jgi:hypothetical protein